MLPDIDMPGPFAIQEWLLLVPVESLNCAVPAWYDLRVGALPIAHIRCWTDEGWPKAWELYWAGPCGHLVDRAPRFTNPVSAAHWFVKKYVTAPTPATSATTQGDN